MLVRIRSKDGSYRFDLNPTDDISALIAKISETSPTIDPSTLSLSNRPVGGETLVSTITGNLQSLGINHGDLLFVSYTPLTVPLSRAATPPPPVPSTSSTLSGKIVPNTPKEASIVPAVPVLEAAVEKRVWMEAKEREEEVDKVLDKDEGKIVREKGKNGCRCGPKSMCDYCMPLEPYDAEYQATHKIKHLSFHSYLRKINSSTPLSTSSSSTWIPPLSDPSYTVKVPCSSGSHPSWPAGICTKCQPSAVTLSRQTYRMVDHVEFADPSSIEGFLGFWRKSATQRFGYLLGRYDRYEKVPLGVKAVVEAIHEPPQEPHQDGVTVGFPWTEGENVERIAKGCGLEVVGIVYTDLVSEKDAEGKTTSGKVLAKRHANSFFLSSLEVIFSATLQRSHPNISHYSPTGHFSSKFVTCVISGDVDGNVAVQAYQVSDQAGAMVEADMVEASVEPGTMRVKEEGEGRYVPDVFYRYKNEYGIEVKESAKPCFPVEYLLVNVTHGFPIAPNPLFTTTEPFPAENRQGFMDQSLAALASTFVKVTKGISDDKLNGEGSLSNDEAKKVADWLSDWHLLVYLDQGGIFDPTDIQLFSSIATSKSPSLVQKLLRSPNWQTFLVVLREQAPSVPPRTYPGGADSSSGQQHPTTFDDGFEIPPDVDVPPDQGGDVAMGDAVNGGGGGGGGAGANGVIICPHCTFENAPGGTDCDICGLPLGG